MPTNYPTGYDTWDDVVDDVDDIVALLINRLQEAVVALENKVGIGSWSTAYHTLVYNFLTTGRSMWFWLSSAPSGWTIDSPPSDCLVAVKGGSDGYNAAGGTVSGTAWSSLKNHTHLQNSHDHTVAQHLHQWYNSTTNSVDDQVANSAGSFVDIYRGAAKNSPWMGFQTAWGDSPGKGADDIYGIPDAYTEYKTENADTYNGATGGSNRSDWRYKAAVGIIATKD
jgi:hypothetical protein